MSYLEQKGHNSNQQNQSRCDLLHLSPATQAAPIPPECFDTSSGSVASIWERPCPVLHIAQTTALELLLDPSDCIRVLGRE